MCIRDSVGSTDCAPGVVNASGNPGTLRGVGSASLAANDLTLVAEDLPANVFGFVILSETAGNIRQPGTSIGTLCLGGAIGRDLQGLLNSGSSGSFARDVDWTSLAQPTGFVSASVGDVWRFQVWHRDILLGQPTSNYTNALVVTVE